jgi:minor extracellular serine protease Vpr
VKHRLIFLLAIPFLFAGAAAGQDFVPGRYIVELSTQEPVAETPKSSRTARRAAVQSEQQRVRAALQKRAIDVVDSVELVANALIVNASEEQAADLAALPGVRRVTPVKLYRKLLDRAVVLQNVTDAWTQIGGQGLAGQGVKIGIIDTGIDASHPAFKDAALAAIDGFPQSEPRHRPAKHKQQGDRGQKLRP